MVGEEKTGRVVPKTASKAAAPAPQPPSVPNTHAKSRKQAVAQAHPRQEQASKPDDESMDVEDYEEMRPADGSAQNAR